MKKHTPKNTKKTEKAEVTYTRLVKAYYYQAFATLDPQIIREIIPETTEPMPVDIFLLAGRKEDKALYYDPAPRSLSLIVSLIVAVHKRVMDDIAKDKMDFVSVLQTVPLTKIDQLNLMLEPRGIVEAIFRNQIITTSSHIVAETAAGAMMRFVKAIVEAMLNCIIVSRHLPGTKTYLPRLCQVARMPQQLIQLARDLPAPTARKKGAAAPAPASAPSSSAAAPAPAPAAPPSNSDDAEDDESAEEAEDGANDSAEEDE